MTLRDTQLSSWITLQAELGERQHEVYSYILEQNGAAAFEVADFFHLPLHSISGRITELVRMGKLEDSTERIWNGKTKRRVIKWVATSRENGGSAGLMNMM